MITDAWWRWLARGSTTALVVHLLVAVVRLGGMLVAAIIAGVVVVEVLSPAVVFVAVGLYFLRRRDRLKA